MAKQLKIDSHAIDYFYIQLLFINNVHYTYNIILIVQDILHDFVNFQKFVIMAE